MTISNVLFAHALLQNFQYPFGEINIPRFSHYFHQTETRALLNQGIAASYFPDSRPSTPLLRRYRGSGLDLSFSKKARGWGISQPETCTAPVLTALAD